ncbi:ABC transporter permease [Halorubellus sp. JP-L1]|uniref:ABC transporter permease n=1 Tax=Halorubellus sp. JP-L1 TaxID=2715753 RepID=UPI001408BDEB|nr:ABC transporter permease [Halorubellus sp. JP-L1]NHN42920.1 ABC transporter permease [Halorubellus sp. JP-L1]
MSRVRYIAFRSVQTVFLLWAMLTLLFVFFRLMPGDYTDIMLAQGASTSAVENFRANWGLDDPLHVQYWRYLVNFVTLDAGTSLQFRVPVVEYVRMKLFNSIILIAPAITVAYLLGSTIGTLAGTNRGSLTEKFGIIPVIFVGSFPAFFIAIVLVIVFAGWFDFFPTGGMTTTGTTDAADVWYEQYLSADFGYHYVLPFVAVVLRYLYLPTLIMRTSIVEVLGQDFSYYYRMTGIPKVKRNLHLARHASLPVITLYPVSMTRAIGGLVLIETVFNWPGIGFTLIQAVLARDFPVVQFVFFLVAAFVILSNFAVDIVYGMIDPRVSVDE